MRYSLFFVIIFIDLIGFFLMLAKSLLIKINILLVCILTMLNKPEL